MSSAPYDGYVKAGGASGSSLNIVININGVDVGDMGPVSGMQCIGEFAFRKGDSIKINNGIDIRSYICFYEKRDYSNR